MRTSVSLNEELSSFVDEEFSQDGESDAQAIREAVTFAHQAQKDLHELEQTVEEQREEIERLRADVGRLQNEKQQILSQREEHTELVRAVEKEQTLAERKAKAGLLTRMKWTLTGMPTET